MNINDLRVTQLVDRVGSSLLLENMASAIKFLQNRVAVFYLRRKAIECYLKIFLYKWMIEERWKGMESPWTNSTVRKKYTRAAGHLILDTAYYTCNGNEYLYIRTLNAETHFDVTRLLLLECCLGHSFWVWQDRRAVGTRLC